MIRSNQIFNLERFTEYSPAILRIGMALVFLWFGITQLFAPSDWTGYLPGFLANSSNPEIFIYANGIVELILGVLLILGVWTRFSALILGLHLVGITIAVGYNAIGIRDAGLAIATLAVAMHGPDKWCLRK